jgi:hypothetical protein
MPDDDEIEMNEDEQEILEATSRHSRSNKSGTTPPQVMKKSVRQDLKLMYQNMTSVTPTSQIGTYSIL